MEFTEEKHKGGHQNCRQTEVIIDVVDGIDGIIDHQQNQQDQYRVDGPGASVTIAEGERFADKVGTYEVGDTAQRVQRDQLHRGSHQIDSFALEQGIRQ